jgi:hypothetical protein
MLWIPFLLSKASLGLLKIDTAYILTVLLFFVLGLLAMESILRRFGISDRARGILLLFGTLATLNIMLGVMYTSLRFIYPLWAMLILHESLRSSDARNGWIAAFALPFVGLLLGPEVGLVTCIGSLAGILWCLRTGEPHHASRSFAVLAALAVCFAVFGPGYFKMILFFGGGAYSLPIFPAPYILAILLLSCWILPRLASAGWSAKGADASRWVSILFAAGLFLPAAFGRCDPGHIIFNGLSIIILALGASFYLAWRGCIAVAVVAAAIIFITNWIAFWNHYDGLIFNALATRKAIQSHKSEVSLDEWLVKDRLAKEPNHDRFIWAKRLPFSPDLLSLLKYEHIATPNQRLPEDIDRFLKASGRYVPEHSEAGFTPAAMEKNLKELEKADIIMVPQSTLAAINEVDAQAYARGWSSFLTRLFLFPVACPAVNKPFIQDSLIAPALLRKCEPVEQFRDYVILRRRSVSR